MRRGSFVVFEGIDASGKSTQARRVAELRDAHFTFEPGDTPWASISGAGSSTPLRP